MSLSKQVIGILMATVEGGVLCHQEINREAARRGIDCPEIVALSMSSGQARAVPGKLSSGEQEWVWSLVTQGIDRLRAAGATFAVVPANLVHLVFDQIRLHSELPLISIVEVVAANAVRRGFDVVGILGTRQIMEADLYDRVLSASNIRAVKPSGEAMHFVSTAIFEELMHGDVTASTREGMKAVVRQLQDAGAQAIVLGCTELGMVIDVHSGLPVIDSTLLLAHAALDRATAQAPCDSSAVVVGDS